MPRRKQTSRGSDNGTPKKQCYENSPLIISDSDENEDGGRGKEVRQSMREMRWRERETRAQMQNMSEEEMLNLAMRLSTEEANSAAQRQQQEEEDAMRKAIAESLHTSPQDTEVSAEPVMPSPRCSQQPQQENGEARAHNHRRKLSYHHQSLVTHGSDVTRHRKTAREDDSPLIQMPDLSQPSPPRSSSSSTVLDFSEGNQFSLSRVTEGHPADTDSQEHPDLQLGSRSSEDLRSALCRRPIHPRWQEQEEGSQTAHDSSQLSSSSRLNKEGPNTEDQAPSAPQCLSPDLAGDPHCHQLPVHKDSAFPHTLVFGHDADSVRKKADREQPLERSSKDNIDGRHKSVTSDNDESCSKGLLDAHEFTSHMVLHLTDDDDDETDDSLKCVTSSPVFPQERKSALPQPAKLPIPSPPHPQPCISLPAQSSQATPNKLRRAHRKCLNTVPQTHTDNLNPPGQTPPQKQPGTEGTIFYYWGVPFCPRGQDPDSYTGVILSQLEVYEKSLKEARRNSLHKAEWGMPVLPGAPDRPLFSRRRKSRVLRAVEDEEEEDEEREGEDGEEMRVKVGLEGEDREIRVSQSPREEREDELHVVVSSPDTEKSLLLIPEESSDIPEPIRQPELQDSPDEQQAQEEITVCPESQMTEDGTPELMSTSPAQSPAQQECEIMEVEEEGGIGPVSDENMDEADTEETEVERAQMVQCPICMRPFPMSKIELHAAYCSADDRPPSPPAESRSSPGVGTVVTGRRKTRQVTGLSQDSSCSTSRRLVKEKCYICLKYISMPEYSQHVEHCIRLKSGIEKGPKGLLPALENTENTGHAGPSNAPGTTRFLQKQSGADDGGEADLGYRVSTSPIKAFTPISEAKDCLIDFKQLGSSKSCQRASRKRKFKK
ncbi:BRCA1-A complex subunit RAP80 isoform X3 [Denticeps clupeoides]|uniref:BRCA1-A complex subunit RAP80 isoform X3 n=1 Tax=Denticeps clupeoides TaxID=299321 RepID=UPI0010A4DC4C|nr:BRCA1-A complex subunit RAP80-like isoform X3 [Denticeps clupeoides]